MDEMSATTCTVPPEGWWCSREPGHDGPCAARPTVTDDAGALRAALAMLCDDAHMDGRYVVLCDDGSVISLHEAMPGDCVVLDRGPDSSSEQKGGQA